MANGLVYRATSEGLIGPDWAVNLDICDMINRDAGQAKEAVKVLKKRINSKSSKVQLLALTLLETLIKNCGDIVHLLVAEKGIPREMVKIVKKKPDFRVREKILVLIDTWQEAFGGPRSRYPEYYIAYQELLRSGAVFTQTTEGSVPIFTPPQSQPKKSRRQTIHSPNSRQDASDSSAPNFSTLSLVEMDNARGIRDILSEILDALDPADKEGLEQDVIVDLVEQCRAYRLRLVHLVNSTSDEELLGKGLALNDDLQRVLAKRDAIAAGIVHVRNSEPSPSTVNGNNAGKTQPSSTQQRQRQATNDSTNNQPLFGQLLLPAPPSNVKADSKASQVKMAPPMDLLTGDDLFTNNSEDSLAIVPVNAPVDTSASNNNNVLALTDVFPQNGTVNTSNSGSSKNPYLSYGAPGMPPTTAGFLVSQPQKPFLHYNGGVSNSIMSQYDPALYRQGSQLNPVSPTWNGHAAQSLNLEKKPPNFDQREEALPPPPWEDQPTEVDQPISSQLPMMQGARSGGTYSHQMLQSPHSPGLSYPMQMQGGPMMCQQYSYPLQGGQMLGNQMGFGYPYNQHPVGQYYNQGIPSYAYANPNEIYQKMYALSLQGNNGGMNINHQYQMPTSSQQQPPTSPPKQEDRLFSDLLSIAKSKNNRPINKTGSL